MFILDDGGTTLLSSTFIGGNSSDYGTSIALDLWYNIYITGYTYSTDFPTKNAYDTSSNGSTDLFIAKFDPSAATGFESLVYSTFFGGSGLDRVYDITVDGSGAVYATGYTTSTNLPLTGDAHDGELSGSTDAFVVILGPSGSTLTYSSYFGGNGGDIAQLRINQRQQLLGR